METINIAGKLMYPPSITVPSLGKHFPGEQMNLGGRCIPYLFKALVNIVILQLLRHLRHIRELNPIQ
jgi:hypothetical protein